MIEPMSPDADRVALPQRLRATRAIVLLPGCTLDQAIAPLEVLIQEGLDVVSLRPGASFGPDELRATFGRRIEVGVHDLTTAADAAWAIEQQAVLALTMGEPEVTEALATAELPHAPAALTPSEVAAVWRAGSAAVQVVPANAFSGSYAAQLAALVPRARLIPRGTESSYEVKAWLAAGAVACCLGEKLLGDALSGGELGGLRSRARNMVEAIRSQT